MPTLQKVLDDYLSVSRKYKPLANLTLTGLREFMADSRLPSVMRICSGYFDSEGIGELAEALKSDTRLMALDVWQTRITPNDLQTLADVFRTNSTLQFLHLRSNNLRRGYIRPLAEAIKNNCALVYLDLLGNNLEAEDACALADALKTNACLAGLDLRGNDIGSQGIRALAEALNSNHTLVSLSLSGNKFSSEDIRILANTLKTNRTLRTLSLTSNQLGVESARALAEVIKSNATLERLYLDDNRFGAAGDNALVEAATYNMTIVIYHSYCTNKLLEKINQRNTRFVTCLQDLQQADANNDLDSLTARLATLEDMMQEFYRDFPNNTGLPPQLVGEHRYYSAKKQHLLSQLSAYTEQQDHDFASRGISVEEVRVLMDKAASISLTSVLCCLFRKAQPNPVVAFCQELLSKGTDHERYLAVFHFMRDPTVYKRSPVYLCMQEAFGRDCFKLDSRSNLSRTMRS